MNIETAREKLKNYYISRIYKQVGVHFNTLHRFSGGGVINTDSLAKIIKFIEEDEKNHAN